LRLKATRRVPVVDDDMVKEQIARLREVNAKTIPIDPPRAAEKGDVARIDYAVRFDDKPGSARSRGKGVEVEVGGSTSCSTRRRRRSRG